MLARNPCGNFPVILETSCRREGSMGSWRSPVLKASCSLAVTDGLFGPDRDSKTGRRFLACNGSVASYTFGDALMTINTRRDGVDLGTELFNPKARIFDVAESHSIEIFFLGIQGH